MAIVQTREGLRESPNDTKTLKMTAKRHIMVTAMTTVYQFNGFMILTDLFLTAHN